MKHKLNLVMILFLLVVVSTPRIAAADACDADAKKYCPVYSGADPRKFYCLKQVSTQVSYACSKELSKITGSQSEFISDCEADYHRFCKVIVPGEGRIVACLREHSKQVSFECRKMLVSAP